MHDHRKFNHLFCRFAKWCSDVCGKPSAFMAACTVLSVWALSGPLFRFSDTWQLVINTGTTIITFLMVFLIQNTQNRENEATQIKLNEIIRAINGAHNRMLATDEITDEELNRLLKAYHNLGRRASLQAVTGGTDTDTPELE